MKLQKKGKKAGFTLIELLVVISIISLLVAIIFPSFAKARELAKRSACAVTLTGLGRALEMYRGDHSAMPNACSMPTVSIPNFDVSMTDFTGCTSVPIWKALEDYSSGKENYRCAADEGPVDPTDSEKSKYGKKSFWDIEGTSYDYVMIFGDEQVFNRIQQRGRDSKIVTMSCYDHFHGSEGKLHNRNYLFLDGHVGDIVDSDVNMNEEDE